MAVGNGGRRLMGPLLTVNFVVYLIVVGLAGWSLDKYIDGEQNHPHKYYILPPSLYLESPCSSNWANCADLGGNPSTIFLLIFALLAGTTGLCSVFQGYMQARVLNSVGLASAATSAIISWGFTALAFGLVCKQIIVGGHRGKRSQTLEAFIAISGLSQLLYLLLLHAHVFTADTDRLTKVKGTPKNRTTISKFTIFRVPTRLTFVQV